MSLPPLLSTLDNSSVNNVLHHFATKLQTILGPRLIGLYLYGSLALGDFNPQTSDIDFIAVTASDLSLDEVEKLRALHAAFESSGSPWASKIEAAYLPQSALNDPAPTAAQYPQVEKDRPFFLAPLEIGWPFQRHTLREHGLIIRGPSPKSLINPVDPRDLRQSLTTIIGGWLDQSLQIPPGSTGSKTQRPRPSSS